MTVPVALIETLHIAVPMWQTELQLRYGSELVVRARDRGEQVSQVIAEHGDDLMYGGRHTKAAFNALAEGIALASFVPGGITVFGYHWHASPVRPRHRLIESPELRDVLGVATSFHVDDGEIPIDRCEPCQRDMARA